MMKSCCDAAEVARLEWSALFGEHDIYLELMGALKPVSAVISAAFSVNSCDMNGGFTMSSSGFSDAFSVNICDGAWSIHCVFHCFCCFLYKYR